jgi:putative methyltransferase (TIGR04325 family)
LPLLATLDRHADRTFRVLDFGGGMGVGYLAAIECLPEHDAIEYHIVDNAETCEMGEDLFRNEARLHFHRLIPTSLRDLNVVYFSTALQYVEDYPALLRLLARLRPRFFLFVSLQAGHNPTFVSAQINFEDRSVVPCWFFNIEEIMALMTSLDYGVVFKSTTDRIYDMTNFDPLHQVPRYCNLLFADKHTECQTS